MRPVRSPFDQVLYQGKSLIVGEFDCRVGDPRFADTGPIENHVLVLPNRPVEIHFSRSRSVVADRTRVLFYNRGTRYQREALNAVGDHCLWFAFEDSLLARCCGGSARRPFKDRVGNLPLGPFMAFRRLYLPLKQGKAEPLEIEDRAFSMLAELLDQGRSEAAPISTRQQRAVYRAQAYLARHYADVVRLDDVAAAAACSPFHLSRLFRRLLGMGIHQHLSELRLRDAVDRLCHSQAPMTQIAMELGFSSPSHFSSRFSDSLGIPPSHFRRQVLAKRAIS